MDKYVLVKDQRLAAILWKERYGESYRPFSRDEMVVFKDDRCLQELLAKIALLKPEYKP